MSDAERTAALVIVRTLARTAGWVLDLSASQARLRQARLVESYRCGPGTAGDWAAVGRDLSKVLGAWHDGRPSA